MEKLWNGIRVFSTFIVLISCLFLYSASEAGMLNESVADVLKTSRYENARSELEFVAESVNRYMNYVVWLEKRGDTTLARPASSYENFVLGWLRGEIDDSDLADAGMVGKPKLGTGNTAFERTKSGKYGERIGTWNGGEIDFSKYTAVGTHSSLVLSTSLPDALTGHVSPPFEMVSGRLGIVLSLPSGMGFDSDDYLKTSGGTMLASITDDPAKAPGEKVEIKGTGQVRFGEEPDRESTPVKQVACIRDLLVGIWDSDLTSRMSPGALALLPVLSARYSERLSLDSKWPSFSHFKYILENDADARTLLEEVSKYVTIPLVVEGLMADVKASVAGKELKDWRNDWWISYLSSVERFGSMNFSKVILSSENATSFNNVLVPFNECEWGNIKIDSTPVFPGFYDYFPIVGNISGKNWSIGNKYENNKYYSYGYFLISSGNIFMNDLSIRTLNPPVGIKKVILESEKIMSGGMNLSKYSGSGMNVSGTADILFKTTPTFEKNPVAIIEDGNAWKIRMGALVFGDAGESASEDELSKTLDFDGEVEIDIPLEVDGKKIVKKKIHSIRVENPGSYPVFAVYPENPVTVSDIENVRIKITELNALFDPVAFPDSKKDVSYNSFFTTLDAVRNILKVKNYVSSEWKMNLKIEDSEGYNKGYRTGGAFLDMESVRTMLSSDTAVIDALPSGKTMDDIVGVAFKTKVTICGKTFISETAHVLISNKEPWYHMKAVNSSYTYGKNRGLYYVEEETLIPPIDRNIRWLNSEWQSKGTLRIYWEQADNWLGDYNLKDSGYDDIPIHKNYLFGEKADFRSDDIADYGIIQTTGEIINSFNPDFAIGIKTRSNGTGEYEIMNWWEKIFFAPFKVEFIPEIIRYAD